MVDVRYALLPNRIGALWGIVLDPAAEAGRHADYHEVQSRRTEGMDELAALLAGGGCQPAGHRGRADPAAGVQSTMRWLTLSGSRSR